MHYLLFDDDPKVEPDITTLLFAALFVMSLPHATATLCQQSSFVMQAVDQ